MTDETEQLMGQTQSNKIKLIKNSKGYSWEISLLSLDIDELKRIDDNMKVKFGVLA